jgi:hypothetical protein
MSLLVMPPSSFAALLSSVCCHWLFGSSYAKGVCACATRSATGARRSVAIILTRHAAAVTYRAPKSHDSTCDAVIGSVRSAMQLERNEAVILMLTRYVAIVIYTAARAH